MFRHPLHSDSDEDMRYLRRARNEYETSLRRGRMNHFTRKLIGRGGSHLKDFSSVKRRDEAQRKPGSSEIQEVQLDKIVGSVNRSEDFDREFRPKHARPSEEKWISIYTGWRKHGNLPPVKLRKVRDEYFVEDGHHRVSVLKRIGADSIPAEVEEFVPTSDSHETQVYERRQDFKRVTGLDIRLSDPREYDELEDAIRQFGGEEEGRDFKDLARRWHETIYKPVQGALRRSEMLDCFPERTAGDLFLWLKKHRCTTETCPLRTAVGIERVEEFTERSFAELAKDSDQPLATRTCSLLKWAKNKFVPAR